MCSVAHAVAQKLLNVVIVKTCKFYSYFGSSMLPNEEKQDKELKVLSMIWWMEYFTMNVQSLLWVVVSKELHQAWWRRHIVVNLLSSSLKRESMKSWERSLWCVLTSEDTATLLDLLCVFLVKVPAGLCILHCSLSLSVVPSIVLELTSSNFHWLRLATTVIIFLVKLLLLPIKLLRQLYISLWMISAAAMGHYNIFYRSVMPISSV